MNTSISWRVGGVARPLTRQVVATLDRWTLPSVAGCELSAGSSWTTLHAALLAMTEKLQPQKKEKKKEKERTRTIKKKKGEDTSFVVAVGSAGLIAAAFSLKSVLKLRTCVCVYVRVFLA